jgi:hypothetical protein
MTLTDISRIRLISQRIETTDFITVKEIVSWMGAIQAQDYTMAKWAIGTRLLNPTDTKVEEAFDNGEVIRTHLMRPTWHFVSAEDIYWMLELTAPQIKSTLKSRHIGLELSEDAVAQANRLIEHTLSKETSVTREEIAVEFQKAKINTADNRLAHFLLLAEMNGIICSGEIRDNKPTYALLNERVPHKNILTREESLAELAKRYFRSHCPASVQDFSWWSGLSLTDARKGLESVKSNFISETVGNQTYWLSDSFPEIKKDLYSVHLLPAYDEFLISYKDRNASLSLVDNRKIVSDNGIFRPVIAINGQVTGLWKRITTKNRVIIEIACFQEYDVTIKNLIEEIARRFGQFLNKSVEINYKTD